MSSPLLRRIAQDFLDGIRGAETTLAGVKGDAVKLRLMVGRIRLDLRGDGEPTGAADALAAAGRAEAGRAAERLVICFDRGDVSWLRGYCHLLAALTEMLLALDTKDVFDSYAGLLFTDPDTSELLRENAVGIKMAFPGLGIVNPTAVIDLFTIPVAEPARLKRTLGHLESCVAQAKEMWTHILAETDD
jgi:hypothetical protein